MGVGVGDGLAMGVGVGEVIAMFNVCSIMAGVVGVMGMDMGTEVIIIIINNTDGAGQLVGDGDIKKPNYFKDCSLKY